LRLALDADGAPEEVTAALAVGADGTGSPLRAALGIEARIHDYEQTALLAEVTTVGEAHTAHERFTGDGPLALLPRGGDRRTLIWTLKRDRVDKVAGLERDELARAVQNRLGASLAPVRVETDPVTYPLRRTVADALTAPRAVLVGNAARTLHPVAAQGFNLALRDVCALAECLTGVTDVGDASALARWRRGRRADQWRTQAFTDVLARYFHGAGPLGGGLRAGALLGLDTLAPARHALAAQSTGMLGGLPRVGAWQLRRQP
jgi:2-octaprenyl-6-methoxyphenol hydroxylase